MAVAGLLPLLFLNWLTIVAAAAPIVGLDSFLGQQFRKDPHGTNDSFLAMPSSLKTPLGRPSSAHPPVPDSLLSFNIPIPITVHLVGRTFSQHSTSLLTSFVTSTVSGGQFHVITPFFSADAHHLSISHNLQLSAKLSPGNLPNSLSEALDSHLSTATAAFGDSLSSVPYSVVDDIIRQDFEKQKPVNSFHIYVINLGQQQRRYAYTYTSGDNSPGRTNCLGSIWMGKERYLWIDLGAGPVDYGPALSGDGILPKGEFHPFAALHGRPKSDKALLSEVASLILSAYQVLLVPSLRIMVPFEDTLVIQFIHIHGDGDSYDIDWNSVEKSFLDEISDKGLLLGGQKLSFQKYEVEFTKCAICSFAVSRATTSYTSRYLFDNYTLIVSEYLDSKRLHYSILESVDEFKRAASLPDGDPGRVLPVYVFDLDMTSIFLLDRYHQSVAFKDMVIAVRTRSSHTVSDYTCNGHHVFTQARDLERPLVGSILQSMWGVSPTHLVWSPSHNSSLVDYTWSVGHTPFGPFSEISSLSFVQKDAARRNVVLTYLNYSVSSGVEVLDSIAAHREVLKQGQTEFLQRWNLFRYKLQKCVSALSHFDYEMALFYVRSSDHDLYAMHSQVYRATQEMEAELVCFRDPPFPWSVVLVCVGGGAGLVYVYVKRERLFRNKRKQF